MVNSYTLIESEREILNIFGDMQNNDTMHVYILFAHPSKTSFSREVLDAFCRGLRDAGHTFETGDLYAMGFRLEMDADQYQREIGHDPHAPVPGDIAGEQEKITGPMPLRSSIRSGGVTVLQS